MSELNKNFGEDNEDHLTKQSDYPEWWRRLVKEKKEEWVQAGEPLAVEPLLLKRFMDNLGKHVKRDTATKNIVFFTGLSAYTKNPINLFIRGESSIGKTYNAVETLRYFPSEDVLMLGGLSPTAIVHDFGTLVDEKGVEINFSEKPTRESVREEIRQGLGKDERPPSKEEIEKQCREEKERWRERLRKSKYIVDLYRKILVFLEAPHRRTYFMLRPILSHDREEISFKFTNKTSEGQLRTSHVVIKGWPATIFLSSEEEYIKDLATRSFTVTPEAEPKKYRDGIRLIGEKKALPWKFKNGKEFMVLQGYIKWFSATASEFDVAIPYARELSEYYPVHAARSMRDYDHFTALIEVSALFHCYQRPILEIGDHKVILATMQDFQYILRTFSYLEETTVTGLPKHILDCFHKVIEPLFKERGPFNYEHLTERYNEVFVEKKSTSTLRKHVELLGEVGWVDTEPDPEDKRKKLIRIIKKAENTIYSAIRIFSDVFTLNSFKKWLDDAKKICAHETILLGENLLHFSNNPSNIETIHKDHYIGKIEKKTPNNFSDCAHIQKGSTELEQTVKTEKNGEKVAFAQSLTFPTKSPTAQEAIEYAFSMMTKRLPDNTTGDMFLHDLQFKGLDQEEAEKLLNRLFDEGILAYDNEGWLVKI